MSSTTVWKKGAYRIDVENPAPGVRPGQMHLQEQINGVASSRAPKYLYNFDAREFEGISNALKKKLAKTDYLSGVKKGARYLGMEP